MATTKKPKASRTKGGRFAKGTSGNPAGRPRSESAALRARLAEDGEAVADVVLTAAKGGDLAACRLVLERLIPPLKGTAEPVTVALPDGGLTEQGRAILRAIAGGELAPDIGAALVGAVGALAKIVEIDELERRLAALEGRTDAQGTT